jgi:hypothetical protein
MALFILLGPLVLLAHAPSWPSVLGGSTVAVQGSSSDPWVQEAAVRVVRSNFSNAWNMTQEDLLAASTAAWKSISTSSREPWRPLQILFGLRGNCWSQLMRNVTDSGSSTCVRMFGDLDFHIRVALGMLECHVQDPLRQGPAGVPEDAAASCAQLASAGDRFKCYFEWLDKGQAFVFMTFMQMLPLACNHVVFQGVKDTCTKASADVGRCDALTYAVLESRQDARVARQRSAEAEARLANLTAVVAAQRGISDDLGARMHAALADASQLAAQLQALRGADERLKVVTASLDLCQERERRLDRKVDLADVACRAYVAAVDRTWDAALWCAGWPSAIQRVGELASAMRWLGVALPMWLAAFGLCRRAVLANVVVALGMLAQLVNPVNPLEPLVSTLHPTAAHAAVCVTKAYRACMDASQPDKWDVMPQLLLQLAVAVAALAGALSAARSRSPQPEGRLTKLR